MLPFRNKLRDMKHPFYRRISERAYELNPTLARELEAAIIR
jgi:hypothetical protein